MTTLDATPKGATSNAYVTVVRATEINTGEHLYLSAPWITAAGGDAVGWTVSGAVAKNETAIPLTALSGTGSYQKGQLVKFGAQAVLYMLAADFAISGSLTISNGLATALVGAEPTVLQSPSRQGVAIIQATRWIDENVEPESPSSQSDALQRLRYPRVGLTTCDGQIIDPDTVPEILEIVTALLAGRILEKDRMREAATMGVGFQSAKLGPMSISLFDPRITSAETFLRQAIPLELVVALQCIGTLKPAQFGTRQIRVERS